MKKLFCIAALMLTGIGAFAQGTVTFANSSATAITNIHTGQRPLVGEVVVGLFGSTSLGLGQDDSSLTLIGNAAGLTSPGRWSDGERQIGAANSTVTLQVRAWGASFASYEAAVAGNGLAGFSRVWEQATGGGLNPAAPITGPGQLNAFTVAIVPEPSTIALGLLGLGAIALFRRRK
jgi:hypothetical protein